MIIIGQLETLRKFTRFISMVLNQARQLVMRVRLYAAIVYTHHLRLLYINLYSPTSGSKERNIQTYKYGGKATKETRNSSGDEIANVNFLYDDIVHVLQNTIDSCINSATDRRGYVLERMFTKFSEITQ